MKVKTYGELMKVARKWKELDSLKLSKGEHFNRMMDLIGPLTGADLGPLADIMMREAAKSLQLLQSIKRLQSQGRRGTGKDAADHSD